MKNVVVMRHSIKMIQLVFLCSFFLALLPRSVSAAVFNIGPGEVGSLIDAMNTANANGEENTINLAAAIYALTAIDNSEPPSANGQPVISGKISIKGQGEMNTIIQRVDAAPSFRFFQVALGGILTLDGLTLRGGSSSGVGGAISNLGLVNIVDVTISDNLAVGGGGIQNFGELNIVDATLSDNGAGFLGGAISNSDGLVNIVNVTLSRNHTGQTQGGAISSSGGTVNIADSFIMNNTADTGGGIDNRNGTDNRSGIMNITRSTISDNSSLFGAGGLNNSGTARIVNSTIAFNGGFFGAGGISNSGTVEIINSTIANNSATSSFAARAGGVQNIGTGTIKITNSTIAGNKTEISGGGIANQNGVVELQNTIIAQNAEEDSFSGLIASNDCVGEIKSLGNNLLGTPAGCSFTFLGTDLTGDPGLATFKDSEDAGKGHFPLLATSQAIDAGNNTLCLISPLLITDQLGLPRVGRCDIGAVEFQGKMLVSVDIRPKNDANKINPNSTSNIHIAIFSDSGFDATTVNVNTVRFGATGTEVAPLHVALRDVNKDGLFDMVVRFQIQNTGIKCEDTSATLSGQTNNGVSFIGSNPITTVPCRRIR